MPTPEPSPEWSPDASDAASLALARRLEAEERAAAQAEPRASPSIAGGVAESKAEDELAPPPGTVLVDEETYQDALVGRKLKGLLAAALACPLSLEIFQDPVIAADGHSYERCEIEAWLARGKTTSPKTNAELPHAFLVPNRHLKAMCQQFLDEVREVEEAGG